MAKTSTPHKIFSHLTLEERIDQACELLAIGVMRLAEKEGLMQAPKMQPAHETKTSNESLLHRKDNLILVKEAA